MRGDDADRIAGILADWQERNERGEAPTPPEVIREHPDLADQLIVRFAAMDLLDRAALADAGPAPAIPGTLGDFRILREIGRGGMGVVYEAEQVQLGRRVALKVLSRSLSRRAILRFQREARAAGRLQHRNAVTVYGMGEQDGTWYYAMELVQGRLLSEIVESLRAVERRRTVRPAANGGESLLESSSGTGGHYGVVARLFAEVAEALQAAHDAGILHRDIKPGNLILDHEGVLKVMDFGLASCAQDGPRVTRTGDLLGTLGYASPEQVAGAADEIDGRTDVYSLGATLYEILTLRPPFATRGRGRRAAVALDRDPPPPRRLRPRIPVDLETVVLKAMERDPAHRYATARELASDLNAFAVGWPVAARRSGPIERLWRILRRNRLISASAAAVILAAGISAQFGVRHFREAEARREEQYARLCQEAADHLGDIATYSDRTFTWERLSMEAAVCTLTEAIRLRPNRMAAYVARALVGSRDLAEQLGDLESGRKLGLDLRAYHLARASIYRTFSKEDAAEAEQAAAEALPGEPGPEACHFLGRRCLLRGDRKQAITHFTRAIEGTDSSGVFGFLSRSFRSMARLEEGDTSGAIDDLSALRTPGGQPAPATRVRIAVLWRELRQPDRADAIFEEVLREGRRQGSLLAWIRICEAARSAGVRPWMEKCTEEALRANPGDATLLALRGWARHQQGDHEEALRLFDRSLVVDGKSSRVFLMKAFCLIHGLKRPREALECLDRLESLSPPGFASHSCRAEALLALGDTVGAKKAAAASQVASPRNPHAMIMMIRCLKAEGSLREALEEADRALAQYPADVEFRGERFTLLVLVGENEIGLAETETMIGAHPDWHHAHHVRMNALMRLRRVRQAVEAGEQSRRLFPDCVDCLRSLGSVLMESGRPAEAVSVMEEAARTLPGDPDLHYNLGTALLDLRRPGPALEAFDRVLAIRPGFYEANSNRGTALYQLGRLDEAVKSFEQAIEIDPSRVEARKGVAWTWLTLGNHARALDALEGVLVLEPADARTHYLKGSTLLRSRATLETAQAEFSQALSLDASIESAPDLHFAHLDRGQTLSRLGRHGEAFRVFDAVVKENAGSTESLILRARTHAVLGRLDEALLDLEWVARLSSDLEYGTRLRAWILFLSGHWPEAAGVYRDLLSRPSASADALEGSLCVQSALAGHSEVLAASAEAFRRFPTRPGFLRLQVRSLLALGRPEDARAAAASCTIPSTAERDHTDWAYLAAIAGKREDALRFLQEMTPVHIGGDEDAARVLAALGDAEGALASLERAAQLGVRRPKDAPPDPDLAALAGDPRYVALRERMTATAREAEKEPESGR